MYLESRRGCNRKNHQYISLRLLKGIKQYKLQIRRFLVLFFFTFHKFYSRQPCYQKYVVVCASITFWTGTTFVYSSPDGVILRACSIAVCKSVVILKQNNNLYISYAYSTSRYLKNVHVDNKVKKLLTHRTYLIVSFFVVIHTFFVRCM